MRSPVTACRPRRSSHRLAVRRFAGSPAALLKFLQLRDNGRANLAVWINPAELRKLSPSGFDLIVQEDGQFSHADSVPSYSDAG